MTQEEALNSNFGGRQLLYSEPRFPEIVVDIIEQTGSLSYISGYDGYAFYQEMSWQPLRVPLEGRGLFTSIPPNIEAGTEKGFAGWACFYKNQNEYDCDSYYIPEGAFLSGESIDLANGDYATPTGFICNVNMDYIEFHRAECVSFLPIQA